MSVIYRCRLCLKSSRNKIDVFKDDFPKMIEILTGLKVDPYDDFPKTSCLDCAKNVKIALKTRKQIIQSHKTLLEEFLVKGRGTNNIIDSELIGNSPPDISASITKAADIKNEDKGPLTRRVTRIRSKLNKELHIQAKTANTTNTTVDEVAIKGEIIAEDCAIVALSKVEVSLEEDDETKKTLVMSYNPDDGSNSCDPPSPLNDPASDTDWAPEEADKKLIKEEPTATRASTKPPPKASDGVFFVKKRRNNTAASRTTTPKPPEIIIRIKKKPKGRTPPRRVTCHICKREVQSYWLQKHLETHEYNPTTCEFCGLVSKSATALRHHVFYYHRSAADEYMCEQCGRSFRSKYRLNLHKKKEHGGTKDFECTICGKKFFERMHLKRHIDKTHKNIRPYVCDFCGKCFKSKNHIKIHERIHSKEAPYNCHMCGESFKMKLMLRTHLKGVHNVQEEVKVFCDICKRGFASDIALKAHLNSRVHETEKCQYCSEMFTREYMVKHLRDVHKLGDNS